MHACGHDVHTAVLMGVAEVLAGMRQDIPGLYINLGSHPNGADPSKVAQNHSPFFSPDESAIPLGIKALANLAVDYLGSGSKANYQSGK